MSVFGFVPCLFKLLYEVFFLSYLYININYTLTCDKLLVMFIFVVCNSIECVYGEIVSDTTICDFYMILFNAVSIMRMNLYMFILSCSVFYVSHPFNRNYHPIWEWTSFAKLKIACF